MIKQTPAQIFKAQLRAHAENDSHRLHATFNFNEFNESSRQPFGSLTVLNDELLGGSQSIERNLSPGTTVMVLPLVGAVECFFDDTAKIVVPGEAFIFYKKQKSTLKIANPYHDNLINFLYITFSGSFQSEVLLPQNYLISNADLKIKNNLHKLFEAFQNGISVYMGIFDGRTETEYVLNHKTNGVFAFAVSGAFEIEGRLIEERDGLALWDIEKAEIESLSENAILLIIETSFE